MSFRMANPEDLEHLAKLLNGRGGLEERLDEAFTRASQLGVSGHLTALKPMRPWARDQARDLRMRALRLRLENGDPTAGLLMAGATREDLEKAGPQISPETSLLANSVAASDDPEAEGLARRKGEMFGDWIVRLEAHALLKIPGLEIHEKTLAEMISAGSDALNVAAATQTAVGSGTSWTKVVVGNSVKAGRIGPAKEILQARWSQPSSNLVAKWASRRLRGFNPKLRSLSAPGSWLPGQLGNMAGRSPAYRMVADVPFTSGVMGDRWGGGLDTARRSRFMDTRLLRFTPNQALNFFVGSHEIAKLHAGTTHSGAGRQQGGTGKSPESRPERRFSGRREDRWSVARRRHGWVVDRYGLLCRQHRHHGPREGVEEEQGRLPGQLRGGRLQRLSDRRDGGSQPGHHRPRRRHGHCPWRAEGGRALG
ncbi:hypothetical protein [Streptomyces sp. SID8014]|uniref:hypothetical protein n=1 Tax=Streptomyces sp. SID8014 TaxID=2706097 RepID=UPI001EF1D205|nr:hypothetical protein [Streptomyces sp. SID8014]